MENEKEKDKEILSDEELKEVSGGSMCAPMGFCLGQKTMRACMALAKCVWANGACKNRES